jgi:hypothetical protein
MIQSRRLPAWRLFRARLVLMLADGLPYRTIQEKWTRRTHDRVLAASV